MRDVGRERSAVFPRYRDVMDWHDIDRLLWDSTDDESEDGRQGDAIQKLAQLIASQQERIEALEQKLAERG